MSRHVYVVVSCDSCGALISRECRPEVASDQLAALEFRAALFGWRVRSLAIPCQGERDYCDRCVAELGPGPGRDGGRLDARYLAIPPAAEGGGL